MGDYKEYLYQKSHFSKDVGFTPNFLPDYLFDFQRALTEWAVKKGRAAIFADCGLGKTPMQLVWAENVVRHTNKNVLILTPLAVSYQTLREAEKFDVGCKRSSDGKIKSKITITNYERLCHFNAVDFIGVVCDESSILKNFNGKRKAEITEFMKKIPYRLLCTATAAPNDYIELGTSSEALGYLGFIDMLSRFFKNDRENVSLRRMYGEPPKWRFKGHAEKPFWKWVSSWARACRKPSELGFNDDGFILPKLHENYHMVEDIAPPEGKLLNLPAVTMQEQRLEIKRTIKERCEMADNYVKNSERVGIIWCHLNEEAKVLKNMIKDSVEISGSDSDEKKENKFIAFLEGGTRILITKPRIGAWGLNFQHCNHIIYFPSHSYEQYYQAIRRCWRFGQKKEVTVDIILTHGELRIMDNLKRKSEQASKMFNNMIQEMYNAERMNISQNFGKKEEIPSWL